MPTLNTHRSGRGLPGYLILFAPHAFAHERQWGLGSRFRQLVVPSSFEGFYPYTGGTATPYPTQVCRFKRFPAGLLKFNLKLLTTVCSPFTPSHGE